MDLEAAIQHGLNQLHDGDALVIRRVDEIGHEIGILKRHVYERDLSRHKASGAGSSNA